MNVAKCFAFARRKGLAKEKCNEFTNKWYSEKNASSESVCDENTLSFTNGRAISVCTTREKNTQVFIKFLFAGQFIGKHCGNNGDERMYNKFTTKLHFNTSIVRGGLDWLHFIHQLHAFFTWLFTFVSKYADIAQSRNHFAVTTNQKKNLFLKSVNAICGKCSVKCKRIPETNAHLDARVAAIPLRFMPFLSNIFEFICFAINSGRFHLCFIVGKTSIVDQFTPTHSGQAWKCIIVWRVRRKQWK